MGRGEAVLVVDDDLAMREMLVAQLFDQGMPALGAGSVEEALGALGRREFGVVVCDLHMPGRDGFELMGELQRLGEATPVILMTSFVSRETAERAKAAGAFECLSKPFDPGELLEAICCALRK
jgi:DNA-binding NtrC family response regulator